jgi:hypothetical protein
MHSWLANTAHANGLAIGLKNDLNQVAALQPLFDFAVNEQCVQYSECDMLDPFLQVCAQWMRTTLVLSTSSPWDIYYCAPLAHNITCLRWPLGTSFPHHHSPGRLAACPVMSLCVANWQANKAVFGVEYTGTPSSFCPTVNLKRMSVIKKSLGLTAKPYTSCVPAASSAGLNTSSTSWTP